VTWREKITMHPASHTEAAEKIAKYAYERNQHNKGCKTLSGFLPHEVLQEFLQDRYAPPSHLTGKALSADYGRFLQENDLFRYLVKGLLENISCQDNHGSQDMASRILKQIESDQAAGPNFRKPLHYVSGTEEGLVIAIAIDDRFWTDEW